VNFDIPVLAWVGGLFVRCKVREYGKCYFACIKVLIHGNLLLFHTDYIINPIGEAIIVIQRYVVIRSRNKG